MWHCVNIGVGKHAWCNGGEMADHLPAGEEATENWRAVHDAPVAVDYDGAVFHCVGDTAVDAGVSDYVMCSCGTLTEKGEMFYCDRCETAKCKTNCQDNCRRGHCDSCWCSSCDDDERNYCTLCDELKPLKECCDCGDMFCEQCLEEEHPDCPLPPDDDRETQVT